MTPPTDIGALVADSLDGVRDSLYKMWLRYQIYIEKRRFRRKKAMLERIEKETRQSINEARTFIAEAEKVRKDHNLPPVWNRSPKRNSRYKGHIR